MNTTKIYNNEIYSDELVLIAVKGAVKQRKLKKEDLAFLKEKAYLKDDEFGIKLLNILPLSNPYWRPPSTKTQAYLKRKRIENIPTKR